MKTVSPVSIITECVSFIAQIKRSLFLAVLLSWSALLNASGLSHSHILVATPELRDNIYGSTVLLVKAIGGDQHIGFIVNRPSGVSLSKLFPEHGPSQNLTASVFFGGPVGANVVYALVRRPDSPPGKSIELLPGLYLVVDGQGVDRVIESEADHARFVAGLVVWRAGELAEGLRQALGTSWRRKRTSRCAHLKGSGRSWCSACAPQRLRYEKVSSIRCSAIGRHHRLIDLLPRLQCDEAREHRSHVRRQGDLADRMRAM